MNPDLSGVILAGGRSSRFGSDKARASWRGTTLIESMLEDLTPLFHETLIVTKRPQDLSALTRPGVRLVEDGGSASHPLWGLRAGLAAAQGRSCFVAACDMPFIRASLIEVLWQASLGHDAVIPVWRERPQPLCALYSASCLEAVEFLLQRSGSRMLDLFGRIDARFLREEEYRCADAEGISFMDIDTPQDYLAALELDHAHRPL